MALSRVRDGLLAGCTGAVENVPRGAAAQCRLAAFPSFTTLAGGKRLARAPFPPETNEPRSAAAVLTGSAPSDSFTTTPAPRWRDRPGELRVGLGSPSDVAPTTTARLA